jgi:spermidine/putrescine-binding protein
MRISRRELLAAAATTVAAGCSIKPGSDSGSQVVPAEQVPKKAQVLDPALQLSLPARAVAPSTITQFASTNSVQVSVAGQTTQEELLLALSAGGPGGIDIALVDGVSLDYLIAEKLVEPIDHSLVPNLRLVSSPFSDPPYDSGSAHSVGKDYTTVGFATAFSDAAPNDSWAAFFGFARSFTKRVSVPDDPENVVGAAMLALGHSWSSATVNDLADVRVFLLGLRKSLVVDGTLDRDGLGEMFAVMALATGFRDPPSGIRFVVPKEGAVINMRSYCIPVLAPDPVTAHSWLNETLAPTTVRNDVIVSGRASPVLEANYLVPPQILVNPAIYPPASVKDQLQFSTVTPAQAQARAAVWGAVKP